MILFFSRFSDLSGYCLAEIPIINFKSELVTFLTVILSCKPSATKFRTTCRIKLPFGQLELSSCWSYIIDASSTNKLQHQLSRWQSFAVFFDGNASLRSIHLSNSDYRGLSLTRKNSFLLVFKNKFYLVWDRAHIIREAISSLSPLDNLALGSRLEAWALGWKASIFPGKLLWHYYYTVIFW